MKFINILDKLNIKMNQLEENLIDLKETLGNHAIRITIESLESYFDKKNCIQEWDTEENL